MARVDRDLYAAVGLGQIPHILSMVDRNPLSPTYGSFDRSYWHYKTASFPSGMYQEFVLPLALTYVRLFPGGEAYHKQPRLRELVVAGIRYASRSSHKDGSCDDYFPYERALGAAAFSLYAMTESFLLLGLDGDDLVSFFKKRGRWLSNRHESGQLSNHHALTVLALYNVYMITGEEFFRAAARKRLDMLLSWRNEEGWFPEYEGCDPGYLTATIDFLAKYHQKSNDEKVLDPIAAALRFAAQFMHPDGSFGGEYGSRNTSLFFPHGFELMAKFYGEAAFVTDAYLQGIHDGHRVHLDDDRMCAHLTYNHFQAYLDYHEAGRARGTSPSIPPAVCCHYWEKARIFIYRDERRYAVVSAAKGGVLRLYINGRLVYADSGIILQMEDGKTLVSHHIADNRVTLLEDGIQIEGSFGRCGFRLPSPFSQAVFHVGMLTVGRWASDFVRFFLQKILIVGKRLHPMRFKRTLLFGEQVRLVDEIWNAERAGRPSKKVTALYAGTDHTSIYVAVSRSYQSACLLPWTDYGECLEKLNRDGYVRIERILE
jgi:hypothetical protein